MALALLFTHLAAVAAGLEARAQSRPPRGSMTARMTCSEAMALVKNEGDVIIAAGGTGALRQQSRSVQRLGDRRAALRTDAGQPAMPDRLPLPRTRLRGVELVAAPPA
ncbi:hypothetical protein ACU4GR_07120 [Methylobacterium oryzae CBMB20]